MAQLAFKVAGGLVGSFVGQPQLGWVIGGMIGGIVAPNNTVLPPVSGPRLSDLSVQSSAYDAVIPLVYGTVRLGGNIIWARPIREVARTTTQTSGGKGGGPTQSQQQTEYLYYASMAVGVCEGEVQGVGRIWANGKLIYDGGIIGTEIAGTTIEIYNGSEDQLPSPTIESFEGAGEYTAHRGLCYVVFHNMPIGSFGNSLPQLTFEVSKRVARESTLQGHSALKGSIAFKACDFHVWDGTSNNYYRKENLQYSVLTASDDLNSTVSDIKLNYQDEPTLNDSLTFNHATGYKKDTYFNGDTQIICGYARIQSFDGVSFQNTNTAAGIMLSFDAGVAWSFKKVVDGASICYSAVEFNGNLYVSDDVNIYESTDAGETWTAIKATTGKRLFVDGTNLYVGDGDNLVWDGTTWSAATSTLTYAATIIKAANGNFYFGNGTRFYEAPDLVTPTSFISGGASSNQHFVEVGTRIYMTEGSNVTYYDYNTSNYVSVAISTPLDYQFIPKDYYDDGGATYIISKNHKLLMLTDSTVSPVHMSKETTREDLITGGYVSNVDLSFYSMDAIGSVNFVNTTPLDLNNSGATFLDAKPSVLTEFGRAATLAGTWVYTNKGKLYELVAGSYVQRASIGANDNPPNGNNGSALFCDFTNKMVVVKGDLTVNVIALAGPTITNVATGASGAIQRFYKDDTTGDIYLCTTTGIWRSGDEGSTWAIHYTASASTTIKDFFIKGSEFFIFENNNTLSQSNVRVTSDFAAYTDVLLPVEVNSAATDGNIILLSGSEWNNASNLTNYFYKSEDSGLTWTYSHGTQFEGTTISYLNNGLWSAGAGEYFEYSSYVTVNDFTSSISITDIIEDISERVQITADMRDINTAGEVKGYIVNGMSDGRRALEPIFTSHFIEVVEAGDKVKFFDRDEIQAYELIETDNMIELNSNLVESERQQEITLPKTVNVSFIDFDYEYQINSQYQSRLSTASKQKMNMQLPIVMTAVEANRIAERILYTTWTERNTRKLKLPTQYLYLQAGDKLALEVAGNLIETRIVSIDIGGNLEISVTCLDEDIATYTSTVGAQGALTEQYNGTITTVEPATWEFIDVGPLNEELDLETPGFYVAMRGDTDAWTGGSLYSSVDGVDYTLVKDFSVASGIGTLSNDFGAPVNGFDIWDNITEITVVIDNSQLSSQSELNILAGANPILIGDEVIQYENATLIAANTYKLTKLLRGRAFTQENAVHTAGERVVVLDNTVKKVTTSTSLIGQNRYYKALSAGQALAEVSPVQYTYNGVNLKPGASTHLTTTTVANDITVDWVRVARVNNAWIDGAGIVLAESNEIYEVDIIETSTGDIKNTYTTTSSTLVYSTIEQIADFGSIQTTDITFKIYLMSSIVGRGRVAEIGV